MINIDTLSILKLALAAGISAAVVMDDVCHRRIPNALCAILLLLGILSSAFTHGWNGLADGLLGAALGFVVFLIPYGIGGMGGGDVKLMAGFGALTGAHGILPALLLVAIAGAGTSVLYLLLSKLRGESLPAAIPYAPAIVVGSMLVTFSQIGAR